MSVKSLPHQKSVLKHAGLENWSLCDVTKGTTTSPRLVSVFFENQLIFVLLSQHEEGINNLGWLQTEG